MPSLTLYCATLSMTPFDQDWSMRPISSIAQASTAFWTSTTGKLSLTTGLYSPHWMSSWHNGISPRVNSAVECTSEDVCFIVQRLVLALRLTSAKAASGRPLATADVSNLVDQMEGQLSGGEIARPIGAGRPIGDILCVKHVARKLSVVRPHIRPYQAPPRRAHAGGQPSSRWTHGARLGTVRAHLTGRPSCEPRLSSPSGLPMAPRSTTNAPTLYRLVQQRTRLAS